MSWKKTAAIIVVAILTLTATFLAGRSLRFGAQVAVVPPAQVSVSYADFIVILLTCIAILVTTLGIGVAFLTLVGWRSIQARVVEQTTIVVNNELTNPQSDLSRRILTAVEDVAYDGVRTVKDVTDDSGD